MQLHRNACTKLALGNTFTGRCCSLNVSPLCGLQVLSSYTMVCDSLSNLGFRSTFTFRTHTSLSGKTDCVRFSISLPIESGILKRRNQQTRNETSSCSAAHTHARIIWRSKNLSRMRHCTRTNTLTVCLRPPSAPQPTPLW